MENSGGCDENGCAIRETIKSGTSLSWVLSMKIVVAGPRKGVIVGNCPPGRRRDYGKEARARDSDLADWVGDGDYGQ